MPTLVIVDDSAAFRHAASLVLAHDFTLVGEGEDVATGVAAVRALRPDVVLMDVNLPDGNGFGATAQLLAEADPPAVVITSDGEPEELRPLADDCGARGFVPKAELSGTAVLELLG